MVRSGPVASQVGNGVAALLKYYNWTQRAMVIYDDDKEEKYVPIFYFYAFHFATITRGSSKNLGLASALNIDDVTVAHKLNFASSKIIF